jgi:hypothetical protein
MRKRTITCKIERVDGGDNGTVLYVSRMIEESLTFYRVGLMIHSSAVVRLSISWPKGESST